MRKKTAVLCLVVLVAALFALPGVGRAAMWVGAEIGGNFPGDTKIKFSAPGGGSATANNVAFKPSVIGGATIGYDFVNSGFGAYNWPSWMRFFSFALDMTYNNLFIPSQSVNFNNGGLATIGRINGYCAALTFLFMFHYGLFPDSEIPTGRVNPYIGVGPAIAWTGLDGGKLGGGQATSTNLALVVEPGIRWVAFPHVSIDTAFRYRMVSPTYNFDSAFGTLKIKPDPLNQFTFLIRANYHF